MNIKEKTQELLELLERTIKENAKNEMAISFSGGLDSSIIAAIALRHGELTGYSVGVPGSYDLVNAEKNAELLGLGLKKVELSEQDIIEIIPKVKRTTGLSDRLNIGIAVPLYASCSAAAKDGFSSILCGQGADELFAGYARYLKMEAQELTRELERDFLALEKGGWKRDSSVAKACGIELVAPFLDQRLSAFARELPLEFRTDGTERKIILRELASLLGLDKGICGQKKKAIQYGSGISKVIKKIEL